MDKKLNKYLHEIDEECEKKFDFLIEKMKKEENTRLKNNCEKTGLSESSYLQALIMGYKPIEQPSENVFEMIKQLRGIRTNLNQIARQVNYLGYIDAPNYKRTAEKLGEFMNEFRSKFLDMQRY